MKMNGQDTLEKLSELLNNARRYENYIASSCPFHDDSRPSFFVYEDTYKCSSCGKWGKTSTLLRQLEKKTMRVVQDQPSYDYNPWSKWLKKMSLPEIVKVSQHILSDRPSMYLRNRGISTRHQIKLGLGMLEDWLIFPIKNQFMQVIGGVARAGESNTSSLKYVIPNGQDPNLLYVPSWSAVKNKSYFYLTFGIIDSISILICGDAAMSTTTGKRLNPDALQSLRKKIYIFPDHGEEKEAYNLANSLGWRGKVIKYAYPDKAKDPNDLFQIGILKNVLQATTH
ncbi:MAG: hypothetical protein A2W22_03095 [Candidatus Levybacteria bacterium RBG_16_35_11]|nr:MAG: hypothetical protein A2W22_03095 [Candidatus Levybacteria bacterium RBG_16_35_11]